MRKIWTIITQFFKFKNWLSGKLGSLIATAKVHRQNVVEMELESTSYRVLTLCCGTCPSYLCSSSDVGLEFNGEVSDLEKYRGLIHAKVLYGDLLKY